MRINSRTVRLSCLRFVGCYNLPVRHGGAVAQLGERLVRNEEVVSSILIGSTNSPPAAVHRSYIFKYKSLA